MKAFLFKVKAASFLENLPWFWNNFLEYIDKNSITTVLLNQKSLLSSLSITTI